MIKIGNINFTEKELKKIYSSHKYICTYTGIFDIHYSTAQRQYYTRQVIQYKSYAKRGTYLLQTAKEINDTIGKKILIEEN